MWQESAKYDSKCHIWSVIWRVFMVIVQSTEENLLQIARVSLFPEGYSARPPATRPSKNQGRALHADMHLILRNHCNKRTTCYTYCTLLMVSAVQNKHICYDFW